MYIDSIKSGFQDYVIICVTKMQFRNTCIVLIPTPLAHISVFSRVHMVYPVIDNTESFK